MAAPGPGSRCSLCGSPAAPSSCPRCNRRLCSLRCFRAHGDCAEAFYRREALAALRAERRDLPEERGRLARALRRLPDALEAEASGEARVPPECRGLWERLSAAEREEFARLVRSGEAERLLPPWRPWWWRRRPRSEGAAEEAAAERFAASTPPPGDPVPALSAFPAPPPSPLLRFQVPNVLYGYAFALCLHRGDPALAAAAGAAAAAASASLRSRRHFGSVAEALSVARADVTASGYPRSPLGDAGAVLAVAQLLEGRGRGADDVTAALSHLESFLLEGRGWGRARRKCRYLRAWARENPAECREMGREAREVYDVMRRDVTGRGGEGRGLIEELD